MHCVNLTWGLGNFNITHYFQKFYKQNNQLQKEQINPKGIIIYGPLQNSESSTSTTYTSKILLLH